MKFIQRIFLLIIVLFVKEISAQSKEVINAFNQSHEYETSQKYASAISVLNSVYNTSSYEMNLRLGWLHYLSGKHKESISYYQKAINIMPASTEAKWAIITPLSALENWSEVEKQYLAILNLDSKNATANYNLGLIYYYRKNYITAKKYFDVALNLFPFGYNNMLMSAWTNYFLGNKNEAVVLFNKTLLYSPNDKSALEGLSLIK